jgi:TonB family protein
MTSERTLGLIDGIAQGLIHRAARRVPGTLSERLEEEWLADVAQQAGRVARLRFALGCYWATNAIVREHVAAAIPATSVAAGAGNFVRYPKDEFSFFTGRTMTFVLVASLHVAVLYGLAMGLGQTFTKAIVGPFELHRIEPVPRSSLPPPPPPQLLPMKFEQPLPEVMPPIESDPTGSVQTAPPELTHPVVPLSPPAAVNRVQGGPGVGFPSADDFYPDMSIRRGEKGIATVKACVNGQGRLTSEPAIIQSSGSSRLDEAALRLAKSGSGHYRATSEDGHPVNSCYPFRIRFELRN